MNQIISRTLTGIGLMAATTLAVTASIVPGGALEGRATSLRIDEPTTTTTVAPAPAETPVVAPVAVKAPVAVTTTTAPPGGPAALVAVAPEPKIEVHPSGHYTCPAGMDATTQYGPEPDCQADVTADPGPANASPNNDPALPNGADGDQPGQTLGSTDPAYGAWLSTRSCEVKPWTC